VADIYEALSAQRPYRDALEWDEISAIMQKDAGEGIDHNCLRALEIWHDQCELLPRVEAQMVAWELRRV